jgi:GNAT superfamily N-acetyltransferase
VHGQTTLFRGRETGNYFVKPVFNSCEVSEGFGMPESLTLEEFIGDAVHKEHFVERHAERRLQDLLCGKKLFDRVNYTFWVGCTKDVKWAKGIEHLIVVTHKDTPVGYRYFGVLYLQPEHRGQGLGVELNAQLFRLAGPKVWKNFSGVRNLTTAGMACTKRTYALLIERGYIYDPTKK